MFGRELFAYLEVPNFAGAMAELAKDPENQRWQAFMAPLMDVPMGFREGQPLEVMEEVFHLD